LESLFEYLGAQRPILAIVSKNGEISKLLRDTKAGYVANHKEDIKYFLKTWLQEWKLKGEIKYYGRREESLKYTRRGITNRLCRILDNVY